MGQPTPMPSAGGSSAWAKERPLCVLRCCGPSRAPDLCAHGRIRGVLARGGAGGGASSEPQRGSQGGWPGRTAGLRPKQAREETAVAEERHRGEGAQRQRLGARRCGKMGTQSKEQRNGEKVMMRAGAKDERDGGSLVPPR